MSSDARHGLAGSGVCYAEYRMCCDSLLEEFFVALCVGSMYFVSIDKRSIVKRLFENQKDCVYTSELF